jgi:hypothetical protein
VYERSTRKHVLVATRVAKLDCTLSSWVALFIYSALWVGERYTGGCNFRANNSKTFLAYGVQLHKFWNNRKEHDRCRGCLDFTTSTADLRIVEPLRSLRTGRPHKHFLRRVSTAKYAREFVRATPAGGNLSPQKLLPWWKRRPGSSRTRYTQSPRVADESVVRSFGGQALASARLCPDRRPRVNID